MRIFSFQTLFLLLTGAFFCGGCKVLFWSDAVNWQGGTWRDESAFIEIQLEYESKADWNPLNQNVLSRNYTTTILQHRIQGDQIQTTPLAHYPGWTLNGSLFVTGTGLVIAQRGTDDGYGGPRRELIAVRLDRDPGQNEPRTILKPELDLLAAYPAPDGSLLAVILSDATISKRTDQIFIDFLELNAEGPFPALSPRVRVEWKGAPGVPNLAWSKDSARLYMQAEHSVLEIVPGRGDTAPAAVFPQCFRPTRSGQAISESGQFFFRTQEGGIATRTEEWLSFDKIPMTARIDQIGAGCP